MNMTIVTIIFQDSFSDFILLKIKQPKYSSLEHCGH